MSGTHIRSVIRKAALDALDAAMTTENVISNRTYPLSADELPAVLVFTKSEESTVQTMSRPRRIERKCSLVVEGYVESSADIENEFDRIAVGIEETLFADATLKGLTKGLTLDTTETDVSDSGERTIGLIRLTFTATYYTHEGTPSVAI